MFNRIFPPGFICLKKTATIYTCFTIQVWDFLIRIRLTFCGVRQVYAHEFIRKEKTVNYDI